MPDKKTHITWFVPEHKRSWKRWLCIPDWHPDHASASVWIRGFQLAPYLEDLNFSISYNDLSVKPDVAIFLRRYTNADIELARELKAKGTKIVLDTIVNYLEVRSGTSRGVGASSPEQVATFKELLSVADQVWAVSPFLQKLTAEYHPQTFFVSDSVDPKFFKPQNTVFSDTPLTLGWSGIAQKADALEYLSPVINQLIESYQVKVKVIANRRPRLSFPFEFKKWRYQSFPQEISTCDLCVAPRKVADNYNRGHSIFKIGVFMAMGIPALAGPVPSYDLLLADGQAGAICNSQDEWAHHLTRFITHKGLREEAGFAAAAKMRPYLTPVIASKIQDLLESL